ncbi:MULTISPECIES: hypothetical protein [unclassified Curtobacterium]|jgi:hypothetical protein|uniref:hypothetical protein n=1 Tax=unclassified Curtobacterium TaxID=257496 RepID=UPI000F4D162A|nr:MULTISPECIES: hypothetical protein [unclassified Curtobacterium]ROP64886.1 hypothetical protein EDF55_1538 [Curtobacterium sp. ZW137]ROS36440.1 hypothetical protein EDF53_2408 [Curtobacterium sp. PhB78]ROS65114.1 hypothetical protein EDF42_1535 [Curtobacterium sp. PhB172]TCL79009.1 hypothetical protein EDF23_10378 [Curtobacterium sp. PhB128]TCL97519.1 hypothetical protein EDF29_103306 [Curtobacterium sp. PhB138]
MNSNKYNTVTSIAFCTRTTPHRHSMLELQQLRIARHRAGQRGQQKITCPMIRQWRGEFEDMYEVRTEPEPVEVSRTSEADLRVSRRVEADVQVSSVLLRWHCTEWPVVTIRTCGETDLDGEAPIPAPAPAPNDPICGGYAHRLDATQLPPTRQYDYQGYDKHRSDRATALQRAAERWFDAAFAPTVQTVPRRAGQRVAFDATNIRLTAARYSPQQSNDDAGWDEKTPSPVRRQSAWEVEYAVMTRHTSESSFLGSVR